VLNALGVRWTLAPALLRHHVPHTSTTTLPRTTDDGAEQDTDTAPPPPPLRLLSDVLPTPLLEHLRQSFAPDARYWSEHHYYDPATPFFSYLAPLDQESRPTGSVEQAIGAVYNALRSTPSTAEWMRGVRCAEWCDAASTCPCAPPPVICSSLRAVSLCPA
jgi:hypothetical protein